MLSNKHANKNTNLSRKHSIVSTQLAIKKVWIIQNQIGTAKKLSNKILNRFHIELLLYVHTFFQLSPF